MLPENNQKERHHIMSTAQTCAQRSPAMLLLYSWREEMNYYAIIPLNYTWVACRQNQVIKIQRILLCSPTENAKIAQSLPVFIVFGSHRFNSFSASLKLCLWCLWNGIKQIDSGVWQCVYPLITHRWLVRMKKCVTSLEKSAQVHRKMRSENVN